MPKTQLPENIEEGIPIAPLTSMGIGGPARFFVHVESLEDLEHAIGWARDQKLETFLLGSGTNILVGDAGFDGLVLRMELRGTTWLDCGDHVLATAYAGEEMDHLCQETVDRGLQGIECLSGIPGTVGAGPIQNIGAYGQELSDVVQGVEVLDFQSMERFVWTREECGFGYRSSRFKEQKTFSVVSVSLRLEKRDLVTVDHQQLRANLGPSRQASLRAVRRAVLDLRASKSMLLRDDDPDSKGCGSFFVNPVLSPDQYAVFCARAPGTHPHYVEPSGATKIPAAWLIERAGFSRGMSRGRVSISSKHVQAITNRGGATAREVLELVDEIQQGVHGRFGIALVPEPVFLGCKKS